MKQRSAADFHLIMASKWAKALDEGRQTFVVALDIEGAFDRVWHEGLLAKLVAMGVSDVCLNSTVTITAIDPSTTYVTVNCARSGVHDIKAGVPEGSVLGPLMWVVFLGDCLNMLPEADALADDVTLSDSCEPRYLQNRIKEINISLKLLTIMGNIWHMKISTDKSQFLLIWRRQC